MSFTSYNRTYSLGLLLLGLSIGTQVEASSIFVKDDGKVGIGTNNPGQLLHVKGQHNPRIRVQAMNESAAELELASGCDSDVQNDGQDRNGCRSWHIYTRYSTGNDLSFWNTNVQDSSVRFFDEGWVGIGQLDHDDMKGMLHVAGYKDYSGVKVGNTCPDRWNTGGVSEQCNPGSQRVSIYASEDIIGKEYWTFSDARIKTIEGRSDAEKDLDFLRKIEITDYRHSDFRRGNQPIKKVIGQQVYSVFPQAVTINRNTTRNIMRYAEIKGNTIELAGHEFSTGDKVLIDFEALDREMLVNVVHAEPNRLIIDVKSEGRVLVVGKEVDDFHIVDYDALAMLNISATQALAKQNDELKQENTQLKDELALLKSALCQQQSYEFCQN